MSSSRKSSDERIMFSLILTVVVTPVSQVAVRTMSADGSPFSWPALFLAVLWSSGTPREAVLYLLAPPLTWITTAVQAQGAWSDGPTVDAGAEPEKMPAR